MREGHRSRLSRHPDGRLRRDGLVPDGRLGLTPAIDEPGFAVFRLANGDTVEIFAEDDEYQARFTTGPVVGFRVDDAAATQAEMAAAGIEFFGPPESAPDGYAWSHFRAPDGNVYELMSGPQPS